MVMGEKNTEEIEENGEEIERREAGRPKGSVKTLEGEMVKLVNPSLRYLRECVLGQTIERPSAVRLAACKYVVGVELSKRKRLAGMKVKENILGATGSNYDEEIKKTMGDENGKR